MSSALLINEPPVAYLPSLAKAIGVIDAIVVQQLHYWLGHATKTHDGYSWVYKSAAELAEELGLSYDQTRRAMERQRKAGVLIAIDNPHQAWDRTLWWRVDYTHSALTPSAFGTDAESERRENHNDSAHTPNGNGVGAEAIPETTTENTTESTTENRANASSGSKMDRLLSRNLARASA